MGKKSNPVRKVKVFNHSLADKGVSQYQVFRTERMLRSDVSGAEYNPRRITEENKKTLRLLLESHGLIEPLVYNQRTGNMVSGHQRIDIIDALEGTNQYYLDFAVIDVPKHKEAEINIALNNQSAMGEFDFDLLGDVKSKFPELDLKQSGFSELEIDTLFHGGGIFDDVSLPPSEPRVEALDMPDEIEDGRKPKSTKKKNKSGEEGATEEEKQELKNGTGYNVDKDSADFYIMLMFNGPDQKKAFNKSCGIGEASTYVRLDDIKEALSLDL